MLSRFSERSHKNLETKIHEIKKLTTFFSFFFLFRNFILHFAFASTSRFGRAQRATKYDIIHACLSGNVYLDRGLIILRLLIRCGRVKSIKRRCAISYLSFRKTFRMSEAFLSDIRHDVSSIIFYPPLTTKWDGSARSDMWLRAVQRILQLICDTVNKWYY